MKRDLRSVDWRYHALRILCTAIGGAYFRPRVRFAEPPPTGPFVVACNHVTLLDWAGLAHAFSRPVRFLVTRDYYDRRWCNRFCRWGGAIPVHAQRIEPSALRAALRALSRGEIVGIFPEGGVSRTGRMLPFQRGVARLAMRAGCPVLPATILGAFAAFPHGQRVPRPRRVDIVFGAALTPGAIPPRTSDRRDAEAAFAGELVRRIGALAGATEQGSNAEDRGVALLN